MGILPSLTGFFLADCLVVALVAYLYRGVRSYYKLSHIPGPKLWGWSLLPLMKSHLYGEIYDTFGDLSDKYGPLVRIAPNTLLVSDPEIVRRMNSARSSYTRAEWYIAMRLLPGQDNILSTTSDARHEELRRKMALGYSGKENVTLERDIDDCVLDLVNLLETKYLSKPDGPAIKTDFARKIQFFTSDIMSQVSFDAKFHDLRDDHDNMGYINEIETVFPSMFCTCVVPALLDFLTKYGILQKLAPDDSSKLGFGKIMAICKEQVGKRFDSDGKVLGLKQDMIASFLRHGLTRKEAETEAVLQLAAGSDTTASGLRATLLCLMMNTRAYDKLAAEIDAATTAGKISSDHDAIISDDEARKLPYLQACVKEGLRWMPPIAGMLPKKTPPQGDDVNGYFVPGGVSMAWSPKAVHHSKALYAPDEKSFRPERWIHISEGGDEPSWEKIRNMERNNELVFGYGKYQCLGKSVAAIELNKVITEMVKRFEFTVLNPSKPWQTSCYGIHLQNNMWVNVRRRGEASLVKEKV